MPGAGAIHPINGGTMANSWNQISIGLVRAYSGIAATTAAPKPF